MGYGLIGYGSWVMGCGLRVVAYGLWGYWVRVMGYGLWAMGYGLQLGLCGLGRGLRAVGSGHGRWVIGMDIDMGGLQRAPIDKLAGEWKSGGHQICLRVRHYHHSICNPSLLAYLAVTLHICDCLDWLCASYRKHSFPVQFVSWKRWRNVVVAFRCAPSVCLCHPRAPAPLT